MKELETSFGSYFKLPNPGLRSYFGRVERGNDEIYRTTFFKDVDLQVLLKEWIGHLDSLKSQWPSLFEFEIDLSKKVGPLSVMKPLNERISDIDSYYDSILLESKPLTQNALDDVVKEWGSYRGLRLRSVERTLSQMKLSTSSGNPYFVKRRLSLKDSVPFQLRFGHINQLYEIVQYTPGGEWGTCAVLGWRGQEGGPTADDVKQRVVWMFPFVINIAELQVYQPLIETAQLAGLVPAWVSMEAVDERITKLFDTKGPQDLIVCTDFTKFDQHFNSEMQYAAEYILRKLFTNGASEIDWFQKVFPIKYNIPLAYTWDKIRYGKHGMASGSGGTNADETLAHRALQYEAATSAGAVLNPNSMCLGDDGILSYPGINVEDVTRIYSSHGLEMNLDKQYASTEDCTYLRRWHHKDYRVDNVCVGVYSTCRALGRLAMQERYYDPDKWGPKMVALRQLSILENIKYHPLKEEFVKFCMKGDKFRLGLDIPGFLENIEKEAREAEDLMPDFLGYTKSMQKNASSGIGDWWIVKYLRSLKS